MLETIELPGTTRRTTRLGFGGSGLMGGLSERESLYLLEAAFDAGIRHFDVAPSYGHGMAERCLGKFLSGKSGEATVATKYGILPPPRAGLLDAVRKMARPIVLRVPAARKRLAQAAAGLKTKARFSADEAERSLEHSRRELGRDCIDLLLLHEATAADLDDPGLLPAFRTILQEKRIGMFGIGGERGHLVELRQRHPEYCHVLQFESSAIDAVLDMPDAFCIHYRTISAGLPRVHDLFAHNPNLCGHWSEAVDADLANPQTLAGLLLAAALAANPTGMVLFSSRVPEHIQANVRFVDDKASAVRARRFLELLRNMATRGSATAL